LKFKESILAHKYLDGLAGIEIGASAHNPFNILNCKYVDKYESMDTIYKIEEKNLCGEVIIPDIISEGNCLPFEDSSLDYVLTSHVLEHFYDTIGTLKEWIRVVKNKGIIFFVFPHKERTFEIDIERTKLNQLIKRHEENMKLTNDTHHTTWITEDAIELCNYLNLKILEVLDVDDKVGNGFTIVLEVEK
jgi:ubiquinone/menaquinone biosynthesis C-methylase UbiE